jgi:hypothetical protein
MVIQVKHIRTVEYFRGKGRKLYARVGQDWMVCKRNGELSYKTGYKVEVVE